MNFWYAMNCVCCLKMPCYAVLLRWSTNNRFSELTSEIQIPGMYSTMRYDRKGGADPTYSRFKNCRTNVTFDLRKYTNALVKSCLPTA